MDTNTPSKANLARQWTLSWIALVLAFGLHVADEAANDFLDLWNPLVESLRARTPFVPLPTFSFGLWLGGLIIAFIFLLSLTVFVRRGASWMRPISFALATIMLGNGALHILGSVYWMRLVPGVYSSPLLLCAAVFLFIAASKHRVAGA